MLKAFQLQVVMMSSLYNIRQGRLSHFMKIFRTFLVVRMMLMHEGMGLIPSPGRFHGGVGAFRPIHHSNGVPVHPEPMLCMNRSHHSERPVHRNYRACAPEPMLCYRKSHCIRSQCIAAKSSQLSFFLQLESLHAAMKTPKIK